MLDLFLAVLSMSITAGLAVLVIVLLRGSLGRALPRTFSYALWLIVLYRMICPLSFPSFFSALGGVRQGLDTYTSTLKVVSLKEALDFEVLSGHRAQELGLTSSVQGGAMIETSDGLTAMTVSAVPGPADYFTVAVILLWILGIFALLLYNGISYGRLCQSMGTATLFEDHELQEECRTALSINRKVSVSVSDRTESPFVYGVLKPRVILPASEVHSSDAQSRERLRHILLHELYHIKRFDYLVKALAFLALCVHWFNPVLWAAFRLSDKDMEMSCDEGVVKALKTGAGEDYAATLLNMASGRNGIGKGCALAFHETNVGERVKHIVKYKKPGLAAGVIAVVLLIFCAVSLLSAPASLAEEWKDGQTNILVMCNAEGSDYPDTILLLGYHSGSEEVSIAFLPRDLNLFPEDEELGMAERKLSGYAGGNPPEAVKKKLSEFLGIEIHHFVKFDTGVFRDLVDAVGGVEFDVPVEMRYSDPYQNLHIDLKKGVQVLNGEKAEMLVRYRKGYPEGDLRRIEVEKAFLAAMIQQKSELKIHSAANIYQGLSGKMETDLDLKKARNLISLFLTGKTASFVDLPLVDDFNGLGWTVPLTPEAKEMLKEKF